MIERKSDGAGLGAVDRSWFEGMSLPEDDFTSATLAEFAGARCGFSSWEFIRLRFRRQDLAEIRRLGFRVRGYDASKVAIGRDRAQVLFFV